MFDYNFELGMEVELHILMPVQSNGSAQKILIVHGKVCYSTHDSKYFCFRVGISFYKFEVASDRDYLINILTTRQTVIPKSRYAPL